MSTFECGGLARRRVDLGQPEGVLAVDRLELAAHEEPVAHGVQTGDRTLDLGGERRSRAPRWRR